MDRAQDLRALRQTLASLDPDGRTGRHGLVELGAGPVDDALGGGLARGAVHEIFASRVRDFPAAAGFALGIGARADAGKPLLWIRQRHIRNETGQLHAPGLAGMGLAAGETILVLVDDIAQGLRAGLEALRCDGLGTMVLELWGESRHFDATASRKLALAAQQSGVVGLMVRAQARPVASSAATRWDIVAAPSSDPLGLPGLASFSARLLRQRSSAARGVWPLEWNHETRAFALPALSRSVAFPAFNRPDFPDRATGWARAG